MTCRSCGATPSLRGDPVSPQATAYTCSRRLLLGRGVQGLGGEMRGASRRGDTTLQAPLGDASSTMSRTETRSTVENLA